MKNDENIININDEPCEDTRTTEVPLISIERTKDTQPPTPPAKRQRGRVRWLVPVALTLLIATAAISALWYYRYDLMNPGIPVTRSDKEVITELEAPFSPDATGTTMTSDSIFGVAMDFYSLCGLRASLEPNLPDTADRSLVLFMRSADYHPEGTAIGTLVINGKRIEAKERNSRAAYLAISKEGKAVTGVSLSDKLADHATRTGGSFFRQFILLSDGTLPTDFRLHGKVERAALARMADGSLFYVTTRNKETMYDFADAMREYGVVDAMYITGGNSYTFHRDTTGAPHCNDAVRKKIEKYSSNQIPTPFLVFRTGKPNN